MVDWKPVPGFDPYEVSADGRVRNGRTGRVLKPYLMPEGYLRVNLRRDGRHHNKSAHRLVAEAFVPKTDPAANRVCFLDGDRSNIAVDNLAWMTLTGMIDMVVERRGWWNHRERKPKRKRKPRTPKATPAVASEIRRLRSLPKRHRPKLRELAKRFHLSESMVSRIASGTRAKVKGA